MTIQFKVGQMCLNRILQTSANLVLYNNYMDRNTVYEHLEAAESVLYSPDP